MSSLRQYLKPFLAGLLGAALCWFLVLAWGQWRVWTMVRDFVVPIMVQQQQQQAAAAKAQQTQQPPVPAPSASPSGGK